MKKETNKSKSKSCGPINIELRRLRLLTEAMADKWGRLRTARMTGCSVNTIRKLLDDKDYAPSNPRKLLNRMQTVARDTAHMPRPSAVARVWRTMRILRKFTSAELAASSGAHIGTVRFLLSIMTKAGYLEVSRASRRQEGDVWILTVDTGPKEPLISREHMTVYDRNLDTPIYAEGESKYGRTLRADDRKSA